ncbi:hypothetical protein FRC07_007587 [Ceratobasidium sp. 392]|nr:hypothetical protein FRC07_007587 [Ceratobasidium sp. 392]
MPRKATIFTDVHTMNIPAFQLGDNFTGTDTGLFYDKKKRMTLDELRALVDPTAPSHNKDNGGLYNNQSFLYAQCRMLLEPTEMPNVKASLSVLRNALWTAVQAGQTPPLALLELKNSAKTQFNNMLERIRNMASATRYICPTIPPPRDLDPLARNSKQRRQSEGPSDLPLVGDLDISPRTDLPSLQPAALFPPTFEDEGLTISADTEVLTMNPSGDETSNNCTVVHDASTTNASIHILLAIAVSTSRDVTNHLTEPEISEIENALRQPNLIGGAFTGLMSTCIVGFIQQMQTQFPQGMLLGGRMFGVSREEDDEYLTSRIKYARTDFPQLDRGPQWTHPVHPFPLPRSFNPDIPLCPTKIIRTKFDHDLQANRQLPPPLAKQVKDANIPFTEAERTKALNASRPETMDELEAQIRAQLATGTKKADSYIRIDLEMFSRSNLLIHGEGGKEEGLICFVMSQDTLTAEEKDYILQLTKITVGVEDHVVDTAKIGPKYDFKGQHYGAWGKMSKSLQEQIPGLLLSHQTLFDSLNPALHQLGSAPFCMAVLNVQPMTRAHRDSSDELDSICLILALGEHEGGDLCLYEPGLRIPLPHGTFMAIRSKRSLHFNLHFKGQRFSYVFTSDGGLRRWATDRNHMPCLQKSTKSTEHEQSDQEYESEEDFSNPGLNESMECDEDSQENESEKDFGNGRKNAVV